MHPSVVMVFALAATGLAPAVAAADVPVETRALRALRKGDHARALALFLQAHEDSPRPEYLLQVARCYEATGDFGRAATRYRQFLDEAPDAAERLAVEQRLRAITPRVGRLTVETGDPDAKIIVDHDPPLPGPTLVALLTAGRHEIAVVFSDGTIVPAELDLRGGRPTTLRLAPPTRLDRRNTAAATAKVVTPDSPPSGSTPAITLARPPPGRSADAAPAGRRRFVAPAAVLALALGVGGGGAALRLQVRFENQGHLVDGCLRCTPAVEERLRSSEIAAWALVGGGGALLLIDFVLWGLAARRRLPRPPSLTVIPHGAGAALVGSF